MLTTGSILQNRYRVARILGQGGMGAVYRAWDTRLNIPVAIKEMVPQPGLNPATLIELRVQFKQEAAILARLHHPNLVRVTDFFEENDNAYLIMDFVEGESMGERIVREGMIPEAQLLNWAGQLLDALAYCHDQGILHRDIKPQNVIIRSDGRALLVDFGLVKLWDPKDPQTRTAMRGMGTPEYAPPEQYDAQSGHTDPRSDLYSLGALLYHALTGHIPPTATRRIVDIESLVPIEKANSAVSQRTRQVISRAMKLRPDERFSNAQEMAAALVGGVGTADPTLSPPRTLTLPEEQPGQRINTPTPVKIQTPTPPVYTEEPAKPSGSGFPTIVFIIGGVGIFLILCLGAALLAGAYIFNSTPTEIAMENTATPRPTRTPRPPTETPDIPERPTDDFQIGEQLLSDAENWDLTLSDSFDSDQGQWLVEPTDDEWASVTKEIAGGKYHWEVTSKQAFLSWVTPEMDDCEDFYVSVEVRKLQGPWDSQYGVIFRKDEDNNYYLFQISGDSYTLYLYKDSEWVNLIPSSVTDALEPSRTNRLTVVGQGNHFVMAINGKYVAEYEDNELTSGKVGVMVGLVEVNETGTFEFDNYELRTQ